MATPSGTINYKGVVVRSAHTTVFERCGDPNCHAVHLFGLDNDGLPFCEMALTEDMCLRALRTCNSRRWGDA